MQWFYLSKTDLWRGRLSLQIHLGELNLEGRKASAGLVMRGEANCRIFMFCNRVQKIYSKAEVAAAMLLVVGFSFGCIM